MAVALITGGAGFFGGLLKRRLLEVGSVCVSIDLENDDDRHPHLTAIQGDIRNKALLEHLFEQYHFDVVFHCAAMLAHAVRDKHFLWTSNVDGTRNIAECAKKYGVPKVIFISSNCLWGEPMGRPVLENDIPNPIEIYGRSKWEGEKILLNHTNDFGIIVFRCPTIVDEGRLGLLSILFEFIIEGRRVWVVGGGNNRYQFIYAQDLIDACLRAARYRGSGIFHIGSDHVKTMREVYQSVIDRANTGGRVTSIPHNLALPALKLAHAMGISPLGPYQYKMIAEDFVFDTTKIKRDLGWKPTLTNEEMLWMAYDYYRRHHENIGYRRAVSAHKRAVAMGAIRILKWLS